MNPFFVGFLGTIIAAGSLNCIREIPRRDEFLRICVQEEKADWNINISESILGEWGGTEAELKEPQIEENPAGKVGGAGYVTVDESYLEDALFLGDSRTALLYEYSDWTMADYFVQYGMTIWNVLDTKIKTCEEYEGITVREALEKKQYGKIYIMLGINELGNEDAQGFYDQYVSVLSVIHELQPEAVIFVQAILHVSDSIDAKQYYINNGEINVRNEALSHITEEPELGKICYLDCNYLYDGEDGKLVEDYTFDGIHVKPAYMEWWQEYLLQHGVK